MVLAETPKCAAIAAIGQRSPRYKQRRVASSICTGANRDGRGVMPHRRRYLAMVVGLQLYRRARMVVLWPAK